MIAPTTVWPISRVSVTMYDKLVVLEAVILTLGVTTALTIYTLQSTRDFSSWGAAYVHNFIMGLTRVTVFEVFWLCGTDLKSNKMFSCLALSIWE